MRLKPEQNRSRHIDRMATATQPHKTALRQTEARVILLSGRTQRAVVG